MKKYLHGIWAFYSKIIIPSVSLSIIVGLFGATNLNSFFHAFGIAHIILTTIVQYATYELRNPKEYYFYYNIGLSKPALYVYTFIISLFIGIIFVSI